MDNVFYFSDYAFFPLENKLVHLTTETILEQRVSDLLTVFCRHPQQPLDKQYLMSQIWAERIVNEDSLSVAISKLRKVLQDDRLNPKFIKTLSGKGYQWLPEVTDTTEFSSTLENHQSERKRYPVYAAITLVVLVTCASFFIMQHESAQTAQLSPTTLEKLDQRHQDIRAHTESNDLAQYQLAVSKARELIDQYPNYLPAYNTIALAKINISQLNGFRDIGIYKEEILSLTDFVLSRDNSNGEAWVLKAFIEQSANWAFETAESYYLNALKYSPDNPLVYLGYSELLISQGKFAEAEALFDELRQTNPDYYKYLNLSYVYLMQGRYQRAKAEIQRIANSEAESVLSPRMLNRIAIMTNNDEEAFSTLIQLMKSEGMPDEQVNHYKTLYLSSGLQSVYARLFEEKIQLNLGQHAPPLAWARYAIIAGNYDKAIEWLDRAVNEKQPAATFIPVDPLYQRLSGYPGFHDIKQQIAKTTQR